MSQQQNQTIQNWDLVGRDRIVGAVYNRPGHVDGRAIMTSSVLRVRLMGPQQQPVAFTETGSIYWLGEPSQTLGIPRALAFIRDKSGPASREAAPVDTEVRTTMAAALQD